jgi:uncharacterized protein involved in response to NO
LKSFALFELGFRPFYLLASAFAALSVALWGAQVSGMLTAPYLAGSVWHAHEMLFGFTLAVIAGFLFTAVRNWTQQPTPRGALLAAFAALWIAGRVLVLAPYPWAAAIVNAAFPLAVAVAIAVPLARSKNRRNYFFVALLGACGVAALCVHLALMGLIEWPARIGLRAGLDIVLFIVAVVAGRVVPMFTNNGVPGAGATRMPLVERIALGSVLALAAGDVAGLPGFAAACAAVGTMAHAFRLVLWRPWKTLRTPLVWILHASYAWIPVHLALRVAGFAGLVPEAVATHALTVGVIGGMTLGMMTRTARGHSGRMLAAGYAEIACFILIQAAAIVRVFTSGIGTSAVLWSAAFLIYFLRYLPILVLPRAP